MTEIGAGDALEALLAITNTITRKIGFLVLEIGGNRVFDPSPSARVRYSLRDSIIHRLASVEYHLSMLLSRQLSIISTLENDGTKFHDSEFLRVANNNLLFLFDDVIFNSCSLWDYVANLVTYIYLHKQNVKWNSLVRGARDPRNPLSTQAISTQVLSLHRRLVDDLFEYRSSLYHEKAETLRSKARMLVDKTGTRFEYTTAIPKGVIKSLGVIRHNPEVGTMNLLDACFAIVHETLVGIESLIDQCKADISALKE